MTIVMLPADYIGESPALPTTLAPTLPANSEILQLHEKPESFDEALTTLQQRTAKAAPVQACIGGANTPLQLWFAAKHLFPKAEFWCQQTSTQWLHLHPKPSPSAATASSSTSNRQSANTEAALTQEPHLAEPLAAATAGQIAPQPQKIPHDTLEKLYRAFAWGSSDAERSLIQLKEQFSGQPERQQLADKMATHGKHARQLEQALRAKLQAGEDEDSIQAWLQKLDNQPKRILRHLNITREKIKHHQQKQRQKWAQRSSFELSLAQYQPGNTLHRHNLRSLAPAAQWQILIDETGTSFDQSATQLSAADHQLGRVVALVLGEHVSLPPLTASTHAVDLSYSTLEQLIATMMASDCGVFGATVHNLASYSWIGAIARLTRWVLLMLPVQGETRVKVAIEQREPYVTSEQLKAYAETLEHELRQLAPERFAKLHLSIDIMQKDHPYNGYVDAIANVWGSPDDIKRKMLARTMWRDHCLLQNVDLDSIEQFYHRISLQEEPAPDDWYQLCSYAGQEAGTSILQVLSDKLQQQTRQKPALWQRYLREVQHRIQIKQYTPADLRLALQWLGCCQSQQLPQTLLLQQHSLQIAADNHLGRCDVARAQQVLRLANQLRDEIPADACEAALRMAISATHIMDFQSAEPFLQKWLAQPVAVAGLLNVGKLQSVCGQLAAFRGDYPQAEQHFDAAIHTFGKLSDPQQRLREQQQTNTYQAIAWLDAADPRATEAVTKLLDVAEDNPQCLQLHRLARSGQSERFRQYLLLRWLVSQPVSSPARYAYLSMQLQWQSETDHPWMLILAYRGWLLADQGDATSARQHLQQAIDDCAASDSMLLRWMGYVLQSLALSMQLPVEPLHNAEWPAYLPAHALSILRQCSNNPERLQVLNQLLPFNFH